jgi:hypothetical protein
MCLRYFFRSYLSRRTRGAAAGECDGYRVTLPVT